MIVNHRHRFIFFKTRKTAGTSVELALSRFCEPGDLVTPLDEAIAGEETLRREQGGFGPSVPKKALWQHRSVREWRRLIRKQRRTDVLAPHSSALQAREYLGAEVWSDYFKFAIERNPWHRFVSYYWWRKHRRAWSGRDASADIHETLALLARRKPHLLTNWPIYGIGERVAVDRVIFFETLQADLDGLTASGRLPDRIDLHTTRAKAGLRPAGSSPADLLSSADCTLIANYCRREIAAFGYMLRE